MADTRELYEFIFRSSADGILISDSTGCITQINPAAAAMLGVTVEAVRGRIPEVNFRTMPALINLFRRPGEQTLEVRLPKRRLAMGIGTTLNNGGRLILLQDVTEKRELESRREALVHSVSHDLRNPISAIGGFADLVGKFGDLNEQQQKFITRIRQTTSKIYDVAGPLVDLAWMEAGMPMAHLPINMNRQIRSVIDELSTLAAERRIFFVSSLQNPMPTIMGDPDRLRLVLYHLIHNAIIYSHPESNIALHAWGDEQEAYFSVADRGIGIADDELDSVFDRLYRSRDESVRDIPGGGLGLTIARTIIRRHGGDLWATSNLGQGSTFTFVLPAVDLNADN
jgi:two-component system, OmpR family, sensor histidine kinase ResE